MPDATPPARKLDASVTVFCQNEAGRIGACVASIARAAAGQRVHLTVVTNGSRDGSAALALAAARAAALPASVYAIPLGDKSNAINQAMTRLLPPADLHVFADGYAIIGPQALAGLAQALRDNPAAVAATGVAGNGRTMRQATEETLTQGGRLHGQLHAFRPDFLARLTAAGLRLPVGLYRGDGLLGSMACHNLDAAGWAWDGHLIAGAAQATYMIPQLSPLRPADIARQFRRKIRQMRGRLENAAIKAIIGTGGYAALPAYADDMIAAWLAGGGQPQASAAEWPFMALALRRHRRATRPAEAAMTPVLIGQAGSGEPGPARHLPG